MNLVRLGARRTTHRNDVWKIFSCNLGQRAACVGRTFEFLVNAGWCTKQTDLPYNLLSWLWRLGVPVVTFARVMIVSTDRRLLKLHVWTLQLGNGIIFRKIVVTNQKCSYCGVITSSEYMFVCVVGQGQKIAEVSWRKHVEQNLFRSQSPHEGHQLQGMLWYTNACLRLANVYPLWEHSIFLEMLLYRAISMFPRGNFWAGCAPEKANLMNHVSCSEQFRSTAVALLHGLFVRLSHTGMKIPRNRSNLPNAAIYTSRIYWSWMSSVW